MGLFDKKYCDICGEKIGLLGNRKLEDGNLCKDCARKLSPFFSERRSSTVEDVKRQLAYRAENEKKLAGFAPSITFDGSKKVYIDPIGERFIVTGTSNWRSSNPDLIAFSQVLGVDTDIRENKEEIFYKDSEGNEKSYVPPRYVPFWLFDTDVDAQVRYRATKVRTWSDSDYDYTETSHFMVHRGGSVGFEHVPVDGSSKMADDLMESIEPYNISDAVHFQTAYLAGYVADKYDVTAEESVDRANQRVKRSTEEVFAETVKGYTTVTPENTNVQFHGGKARYALYPVWLLNTTWNGNQYVFAMNGQTGKFVGDLPVDKAAAKRWTFLLAAIFSVASYGVAWGLHLIGLI